MTTRRCQHVFLILAMLTASIAIAATPLMAQAANPVPEYVPPIPLPLGSMLPDFAVTGRDDTIFSRADLVPNHAALLFFFAPWSAISQAEASQIATVAVMHPGLQIVPIGVKSRDSTDEVFDFPAMYNLQFVAFDDGGIAAPDVTAPSVNRSVNPTAGTLGKTQAAWGISGYPAIIVVDGAGVVRAGHIGFITMTDLNTVVTQVESTGP